MNHDAKTIAVGTTGFISTKLAAITIADVNAGIPIVIGALTVAGLIPLVITRWQKFLSNKNPDQ